MLEMEESSEVAPVDAGWAGVGVGAAEGSLMVRDDGWLFVTSSGKDLWTEKDDFYWVRRQGVASASLPSVASLRVRVEEAGTANVHFFLKAGIVVRESDAPEARVVAICATSKRAADRTPTVVLLWRTETGKAMEYLAADFVAPNGAWPTQEARSLGMAQPGFCYTAPVHLRLDRDGGTFTALVSSTGADDAWVEIGRVELPALENAAAGLGLTRGFYTAEGIVGEALFSSIRGF